MGIDPADIEGEADAAYNAAGLSRCDAVDPLWLARKLLGPDGVRGVHSLMQPGGGCLVHVHGKPRIYFRNRLPAERRDFVIAHELAHYLLGSDAGDEIETEIACDALAAALIAPREAFLVALRAHGRGFAKLARAFQTTQSLVALRSSEVTGEPLALVSPHSVRVRGERCQWPDERSIRKLAARAKPGLKRAVLTDDRRRVALSVSRDDLLEEVG